MKPWWIRVGKYALPNAGPIRQIIALILLGAILAALAPWPIKLIVDYVLPAQNMPANIGMIGTYVESLSASTALVLLALASLLIYAIRGMLKLLQIHIQDAVGNYMMFQLGADLFDRMQRLSLTFYSGQRSGDLVKRVTTDTRCIREVVLGVFIPLLTATTTLAAMIVIMWFLQPTLTLIALLTVIPFPFLMRFATAHLANRSYEQENAEGQVMANAETVLTSIPVVQAFVREPAEDKNFRSVSMLAMQATLRAISAQLQYRLSIDTILAIGTAVIMVIGGSYVIDGTISTGDLLVFLAYLAALYGPMETLAYISSSFAVSGARAKRVFEVLDSEDEISDRPGAVDFGESATRSLQLNNISFGYEAELPVLQDISLSVNAGETLALVGPTGAGKSTLVAMIPRFFDPWSGRLLIDGQDIRDIRIASLRAQISIVLQEPFLLPMTIAENIAYGRPDASLDEIKAAAKAARIDAYIEGLPDGYATPVGERGATLSGGQRQRLSIARALLKDAPILIMDEPTSALDAETEAQLLAALRTLMHNRTTIIIAHRLSTIRHANQIVFLDEGRIVESGTHDELIRNNGPYANFCSLQLGKEPE